MEVNHEGKVTGKPKGKQIFMPGTDIVTPDGHNLSQERAMELMRDNAGIKTDLEYEQEIIEVDEYNANLRIVDEQASKYKLNGNAILIKLYKHPSVLKVGNMYLPNELVLPYQTEGGKMARMRNPLQFQHRGVIQNISDQCSESFKQNFNVGDVVHLKMGINLMQQRTWLNPEDYYADKFDNWFNINENMIEKGEL